MLTFLEVHSKPTEEVAQVLLACLDVTGLNEQERLGALADLRILYGDALYRWHFCGHDVGEPCRIEET